MGDTTYNINSRPTSIVGNYGIIGDNGQLTRVETNTIVNETNNTVYNPVTNTTSNITNWSYDYSDRSYHVTVDDGTTQTITYGDEYVTIQEGDTVYNVYYVVSGTESSCAHEYTEEITQQPTCLATGLKTFTCSKCGDVYTQKIPALGHSWELRETVNTEYDEAGELITQGYSIYVCTVCGEQYKDTNNTGPPAPPVDETGEDGILGWLKKIYKAITHLDTNVDIQISENPEEDNKTFLEGFTAKFSWVESVYTIFTTFVSDVTGDQAAAQLLADDAAVFETGSGAPQITMDLSAATSPMGIVYGPGAVTVLDLSWYTPYKPTVDNIISGFLWIFFLWGLFKRVPSILSGASILEHHPNNEGDGHSC